ncbi:autotransporter domain-containing protein [Brucella sp. BE17]|uniref:autotransporter domain-containing protein n=1 Tax=Brucella sp. BE17 TaxID=3142977 RepID=UPI0031B9D39A
MAISSGGKYAWGALVYNNSTVDISSTQIITIGAKAHGIQVGQSGGSKATGTDGSVINLSDVTVIVGPDGDSGNGSYGLHAVDGGTINGSVTITTGGANNFGAFAESFSKINISNSAITTGGQKAFGVIANNDLGTDAGSITAENVKITTGGNNASGAYVDNGGTISLTNSTIETGGESAHGVEARSAGVITLNGGSITTSGKGARGVNADAATVVLNDVKITTKHAERFAEGVQSQNGAKVTLNKGSITTSGARGYGLIASNGGTITSSADITTNGDAAHGVQAGAFGNASSNGATAGTIKLTGGTITINALNGQGWGSALHAVDKSAIEAQNISVISKSYGAIAESGSKITISDSSVTTSGKGNSALIANNDHLKNELIEAVGGKLSATNTTVITSGNNAAGASAEYGGAITLVGGRITTTGRDASALQIINSGTITATGTTLASANAATVDVDFNRGGANASVTLGSGTVATQNNGTLLRVNRSEAGGDGVVQFTLGAGSTSQGDILDEGVKTTGGTDVTLQDGASWTGLLHGVRNFSGSQGGRVAFDGVADIAGDLNGVGTRYVFSDLGGTIGGDVNLTSGSSTAGGTIGNRIIVLGNMSVYTNSVLGGNWFIHGDLQSDGIVSPGNSIGVVTVGGDATFGADSVYDVEVAGDGTSDRINVTGAANLKGGQVHVYALDTKVSYQDGQRYTILTAGEGINGEFAPAVSESVFLTAALDHQANQVDLTIGVKADPVNPGNPVVFEKVADTANQRATARALDSLEQSGSSLELYNSVLFLTDENEARSAFTQLSGDTHASIKTGLIDTANLTADTINNRLRAAFAGVAAKDAPVLSFSQSPKGSAPQPFDAVAPVSSEYSVWASGFGSWIDRDGNANTGGLKTSTGGFLSGVDVGVASGWRLGVVGGYSQTDLDAKGRYASASSDNWHLGIYGGNQWGPIGLRAGLVHTWNNIDSSRSVAYSGFSDTLDADYDARTLQAFGELGYRIDTASASFEPFANLSHVRLRTDGFTENGGAAALSVDSETTNTTFTTLGLRASAPLTLGTTTANVKGTLGWRHAYGDITPESTQFFAGSNAFTVEGVAIAKDAALVEAGFDLAITESATFGVSYVGQFGDGTTQNGFNASLSVKF